MDSDQIASYLLSINIGNKAQITEAMQSVYDPTNIDEIITYIFDQQCFDNEDNDKKDNDSDSEWETEPDINPSNPEPEPEPPTDVVLKCHKCDTWFLQSVSEFCTDCVAFKELPASFIKPEPFTYRGYKAQTVTFGYLREANRDANRHKSFLGVQAIGDICCRY
eukprot:122913_1